jgi:hypothetical protein
MAAQTALTVNGMTDAVRRLLEKVPGIDLPTPLATGLPAPNQPSPNNQAILDALNFAIDWVNRKVRCGPIVWISAGIAVTAAPAGVQGGWNVDISASDANTLLIREVNDAVWSYTGQQGSVSATLYRRLQPINYGAPVMAASPFPQEAPSSTPTRFYVSGTTVVLFPPPMVAGTLYLMQTEGMPQLVATSDTIVGPPVSLHSVVFFKAVSILSAREGTNVESAQRDARFDAMATDGLGDIIAWKQGFDPSLIDVLRDSARMVAAGEQQRRATLAQRGPST